MWCDVDIVSCPCVRALSWSARPPTDADMYFFPRCCAPYIVDVLRYDDLAHDDLAHDNDDHATFHLYLDHVTTSFTTTAITTFTVLYVDDDNLVRDDHAAMPLSTTISFISLTTTAFTPTCSMTISSP